MNIHVTAAILTRVTLTTFG